MDRDIWSPHDRLFKQMLGEPKNAASFLESNLPRGLTSHIDLGALEVLHASFIDAQFAQSEADLLFSAPIANRPGYVYILFEHQSSPDAFMALRLLGYMVRVWKRFQRDNPGGRRLPVILPMVLFHGPRGWRGASTFEALVDAPDEGFAEYIPKLRFRLFDLSPFSEEDVAGNAEVRILRDMLGAFGRKDFMTRVARAFEALNELSQSPGFARHLEILFRYVLEVYDIPKEDFIDLAAHTIKANVKEAIMTTYERLIEEGKQIGLSEGKQIGLSEGKQIASNNLLLRMLSKRFRTDAAFLIPQLSRLTMEQKEELGEILLDAESIEEVLDWLKAASCN